MRAFLSLGSNLGNRRAHIRDAVALLEAGRVRIVRASRLYETRPAEVSDEQENYLNMVVECACEGDVFDLLELCHGIEKSLGRSRPYRHAPRTMDIDILLIEGAWVCRDGLEVPHPRMEKRAFVIHPLAEIAPDLILPSGRTAVQVKNTLGDDDIVMILDG